MANKIVHFSEDESIVCFLWGSSTFQNLATTLALDCGISNASESRWAAAVRACAQEMPHVQSGVSEQVFVCRRDNAKALWLICKYGPIATIAKLIDHKCIGNNTEARFLISRLWRKDSSLNELEKLALLALAYASKENPVSVGPPYDVMKFRGTQFEWSRYDSLDHICATFDEELKAIFGKLSPVAASTT